MATIITEDERAEISTLGQAIYEKIQEQLESQYDTPFVAIYVDTGDYAIAKTAAIATRTLHTRHAMGRAYTRNIGSEPEYGLAARLFRAGIPHQDEPRSNTLEAV